MLAKSTPTPASNFRYLRLSMIQEARRESTERRRLDSPTGQGLKHTVDSHATGRTKPESKEKKTDGQSNRIGIETHTQDSSETQEPKKVYFNGKVTIARMTQTVT
jgi:hypothetical protein